MIKLTLLAVALVVAGIRAQHRADVAEREERLSV